LLLNKLLGTLSAITIIDKLVNRKKRRLTSPKKSEKLNLGGPETGNGGQQKNPKSRRRDSDQTQGPRQKASLIKPSKFWVVPHNRLEVEGNLGSRKNDSIVYAGRLEEPKNFMDF
jgi:hypothetical protein